MNLTKWPGLLAVCIAATSVSCQAQQPPPSPPPAGAAGQPAATEPLKPPPPQAASREAPALREAGLPREMRGVREPAVAGAFYPLDANVLAATIDKLLAQAAGQTPVENLRGLICPHAGYEYSGQTAAFAYRQLAGRNVKTVILLAPSHYAAFEGAFLSRADAYRTPLGLVPISPKAGDLAKLRPFLTAPPYRVERPAWAKQSPKTAPPEGQDTPDTWEHAGEVQLPFLQRALKSFSLVSVVYGMVEPAEVAKAIEPLLDDQTVIVASSDLSHYHPYDEARQLDDHCLSAACTLDEEGMKLQEACGKAPILTLLHLAAGKGWRARLLDYRNSGDVTGDKRGVVGYGAVAFYDPGKALRSYSDPERRQMLEIARKALRDSVAAQPPPSEANDPAGKGAESKGCFVTLSKGGALRGCIGNILPQGPLAAAIARNTQNAALHDSRFPPVQADELDKVEIEISVLSVPEPLYFKAWQDLIFLLRRGEDGVILKIGDRSATFLPQVWDEIPQKQDFLSALAVKAGGKPDDWKSDKTVIYTYRVEAFKEAKK